jgi:hypothetical protein
VSANAAPPAVNVASIKAIKTNLFIISSPYVFVLGYLT